MAINVSLVYYVCAAECPQHCTFCMDRRHDGVLVCKKCELSYYLTNAPCHRCDHNCDDCYGQDGFLLCNQCRGNSVLMEGVCVGECHSSTCATVSRWMTSVEVSVTVLHERQCQGGR